MTRRMKHWGWGYEDDPDTPQAIIDNVEKYFARRFEISEFRPTPIPDLTEAIIAAPRLPIPERFREFCTSDKIERARHAIGRSFLDYVTIFSNRYEYAPDVVAFARSERDIEEIYDWAAQANAAVIPFGGGTSTSGGVEPIVGGGYDGVITVDMRQFNRILEVDPISQSARIQGGTTGAEIESELKKTGHSLRHYPQSLQHSTLGGWIATRSAGHFATLHTRIDDYVENVRVVAPAGTIETRRMPPDGAGPDPDRLFLGSEGGLGIITEAWMRIQKRPRFRASVAVFFDDFLRGCEAIRIISQSGLNPSNMRIIDAEEARVNYVSTRGQSILFLGFESADHPVTPAMDRALEICTDFGGDFDREVLLRPNSNLHAEQGRWRDIFVETGYYREITTPRSIIFGIMETSITWDKFPTVYNSVKDAVNAAMVEATGRSGSLSCRFSYVYPDGPAPYWSFYCLGNPADMKRQWKHVKEAATNVFLKHGGSVTHHTSVGRDNTTWYEQQTNPLFRSVLRAAKSTFDPAGLMNPGVVFPPRS